MSLAFLLGKLAVSVHGFDRDEPIFATLNITVTRSFSAKLLVSTNEPLLCTRPSFARVMRRSELAGLVDTVFVFEYVRLVPVLVALPVFEVFTFEDVFVG